MGAFTGGILLPLCPLCPPSLVAISATDAVLLAHTSLRVPALPCEALRAVPCRLRDLPRRAPCAGLTPLLCLVVRWACAPR